MYRALVVEDDPIAQVALTRILEKEGFKATTAATLREAREKYTAEKPHLVLSDIKLPDGSSLDFIRDVEKERYVSVVRKQNEEAVAKQGAGDIQSLLDGPETWTVS